MQCVLAFRVSGRNRKMNEEPNYIINLNKLIQAREIELLEWCLKQCNTGMTIPMIKLRIHNKLVEIKGEGEKA